ncbi:N-sulfoglucosamine sulfohydrolase [Holothuria leucospilota]|uniref:N-sulfoglucosamine sulfohydrolase n=1 Tax=Holothuria leucospilota TaxID=206669 RepID=A0A9Q1C1S7_HOLLE|nr:N-sulfoglucosamine sulfohydrolase [Holothuria leucospilota]
MDMGIHVVIYQCLMLIGLSCLPILSYGRSNPRNVLVIIGDDVGFETSIYNNTVCKTPNLERLAKRSVTLKHGYTSVSSCSPSRSAIMTGLPSHQNGIYGLYGGVHHFHAFDNVKTLPVILRPHGIKTGIIGKKHVGPPEVFKYDYEKTEFNLPMLQCARNITKMKGFVREFFAMNESMPFLLYIGFNDCHRCPESKFGDFCEKFGNGQPEYGVIPDWKPAYYDPKDVIVPPFLPDTPATRGDIANQYTSMSRLDAGIGMLLDELKSHGYLDNTLILYSADNGIPFPNAKTNLYESGMGEPFLVSSPFETSRWGEVSESLASTTDILPTVLEWFDIPFPSYKLNGATVALTGKSLLPLAKQDPSSGFDHVFSSHNFHEVYMYYPMRVMRNKQYRLIHNLNYMAPYPIATDLYDNPTFKDILNHTLSKQPTKWFKTLEQYYYRDEYELYDVVDDPLETNNLAHQEDYADIFEEMHDTLYKWRLATNDYWKCYPEGVRYKNTCADLDNAPPYQKYVNPV